MDDFSKYSYTPTPLSTLKKSENEENSEYIPTLISQKDWYQPDSLSVAYNPNFQFDKNICATPRYGPSDIDFSSPKPKLAEKKPTKVISNKKEIKNKKLENLLKDLCSSSDDEKNNEKPSIRLNLSKDISIPSRPPQESCLIDYNKNFESDSFERPTMPSRPCTFVPLPIRMRYLDQFVDFYLKISSALSDEQKCIDQSLNRPKYLRAVVQKLRELKEIVDRAPPIVRNHPGNKRPSSSIISNSLSVSSSSILPKKQLTKASGSDSLLRNLTFEERLDQFVQTNYIYSFLKEFLLTKEQLYENGFPIVGEFKGSCKIKVPDKIKEISELPYDTRMCCRCNAKYKVDSYGAAINKIYCEFHWGKPLSMKTVTGWQAKYSCCQMPVGTSGCDVCKNGHVSDANRWLDTQEGFFEPLPPLDVNTFDVNHNTIGDIFRKFLVSTRVPRNATEKTIDEVCIKALPKTDCKIYALDCEMVYTTKGYELGRITIVDTRCEIVIDKLVKPSGTILDCNSRFSGLHSEDFEKVSDYLTHIQLELCRIFDSETILMGHSLENDLIAIKITHPMVVDTSVVYPHKYGPPKKRALKNLAFEIVNMTIQNNIDGHDSKEDAVAVMKIMQHKVREMMRKILRTPTIITT